MGQVTKRFLTKNISWRDETIAKKTEKIDFGTLPRASGDGRIQIKKVQAYNGATKYYLHDDPEAGWEKIEIAASEQLFAQCRVHVFSLIKWRIRSAKELTIDVLEFIRVHHADSNLIMVDITFPSAADSYDFILPDWVGEEVTQEYRYSDVSLCLNGVPRR